MNNYFLYIFVVFFDKILKLKLTHRAKVPPHAKVNYGACVTPCKSHAPC